MLDMNHNTSTPADGMENFNDKTLGLYVVGLFSLCQFPGLNNVVTLP